MNRQCQNKLNGRVKVDTICRSTKLTFCLYFDACVIKVTKLACGLNTRNKFYNVNVTTKFIESTEIMFCFSFAF